MNTEYKIFDSHAHYDDEEFDNDRKEVLEELKNEGVIGIMNCSSSYKSIAKTCELINTYDFIYGAVGIHPENADEFKDEMLDEFKDIIKKNPKVKAIGERGLDYYWDENPDKEIQKDVFRRHMKWAEELNVPVIIHDRDAHEDTLNIIKEFPNVKGVVHCFSGSVEFAKECLKLGYYIGVTGVVTFKNAKKVVKVVKEVPVERLLVETDCPYMAPEPNRGKRNKSSYIKYVIEKISEIKEINPKELNLKVNENLQNLFKIQ